MSVNLLVLSDLHLEWHRDEGQSFIKSLDTKDVDVLVLAGDIDCAPRLEATFEVLCARFPQVVWVMGNHEFYGYNPVQALGFANRAARRFGNLHWLNDSTVTLGGVRFLGCTLWFPKPSASAFKGGYNDYFQIKGFEPWVYDEHRASIRFLSRELRAGDVLVTHFMPLRESIHEAYRGHPLNCFFYAGKEADKLVRESGAQLVVHGHTHCSFDYRLPKGTRVVCNPFGYVRHEENSGFNEGKIVEVF